MTIYTVLYDDARSPGPAGDGTHTMRFRSAKAAREFAMDKTLYGQPADVDVDRDVPARIADRWMASGMLA